MLMNTQTFPEATQQGPVNHFASLQALRGIAALLVVMYHIESRFPESPWSSIYAGLFSRGHIGVDLFFVLSGFIMTYFRPSRGGVGVAANFLARRFLRIWPSYLLATLLAASIIWYHSIEQIVMSLAFLPQSAERPLVLGNPTLFIGWTLNYEAYFYLLCAALLLLPARRWYLPLLSAWVLLTLVVLPLSFGQDLSVPPLEVPADKYPWLYLALMSNPIIWEFIMGVVVALVIRRWQPWLERLDRVRVRQCAVAACIFYLFCYLGLDNKMEPIACGLPSAILVAALVIADMHRLWKIPWWLRLPGDSSYCIYLLHWLWVFTFKPVLAQSLVSEAFAVVLIVILTLLSAELMHRLYERPILVLGKRLLK